MLMCRGLGSSNNPPQPDSLGCFKCASRVACKPLGSLVTSSPGQPPSFSPGHPMSLSMVIKSPSCAGGRVGVFFSQARSARGAFLENSTLSGEPGAEWLLLRWR